MAIYRHRNFRRNLGVLPTEFESLGFTLWEWLHPEERAAEYEAVGKVAPPPVEFSDVIGAATEDVREVVTTAAGEIAEGAEALASGAQKVAIAVGIAGVLAALVYFSQKRGRK